MSSNAALDRFSAYIDASDYAAVDSYELAGIDGNTAHAGEGYHTWRERLSSVTDYSSGNPRATNYSPRDANGSAVEACAIDLHFDGPDMIAVTQELLAAAARRDPRMSVVREFNGTVDGVHTLNRDAVLGWRQNYTPDSSHLSHVHVGFFRDVAGNWDAIKPVADLIDGVTAGHTAAGGTATSLTEDDMTPDELIATLKSGEGHALLTAAVTASLLEPHALATIANALWQQRITLAGLGTDTAASLLANARSLAGQARNAATDAGNAARAIDIPAAAEVSEMDPAALAAALVTHAPEFAAALAQHLTLTATVQGA